jgi:Fic family protein
VIDNGGGERAMTELLEKVGKRLGNVSDLPEELRNQLQATKIDELERQILDVLSSLEGIANLDEILVGLYRKFSVIQERQYLSNKLYRMAKAGHIITVKGKKGVYKTS